MLFPPTIAGSLPKPGWLAEPEKLWAEMAARGRGARRAPSATRRSSGSRSRRTPASTSSRTASSSASISCTASSSTSRASTGTCKTKMGIRNNRYVVDVPTVTGPIRAQRPGAPRRGALLPRAHQARAEVHAARPDDDLRHASPTGITAGAPTWRWPSPRSLNEEARELEAAGVDVIQFDEPAFNVFMDDVNEWGIAALERAARRAQLHDRRPHLLRLRHRGQPQVEGDARLRSGGNTRRSFRRSTQPRSSRSRSNAPTRACRSR